MLKYFPKIDWIMFFAMLLLASLGVLMVYSTTAGDNSQSSFLLREVVYIFGGLVLFFVVLRINLKILINLSPWLYGFLLVLLLITFFIGVETRGSTRWIDLGFFKLQASEIAKPIIVLTLVWFFQRFGARSLKNVVLSLILVALPAFLVFKQPDLGSSFVLLVIWLTLTYLSGLKLRYLLGFLVTALVLLPFVVGLLAPYQRERLFSFLNPGVDPLGANYNLVQSIIAVGSGQLLGQGFGRGAQSHLNFLPEQKTDFIFATTAEDLGFFGVCLILVLFAVLLYRIIRVGVETTDKNSSLVCFGALVVILCQLFVNAGMNMGLLPVTGITLPFISYGGSSLISMMILVGLVQSARLSVEQKVLLD